MTPADAILGALALHLLGGAAPFMTGRRAERLAAVLSAGGSMLGIAGAVGVFLAGAPALVSAPWRVPLGAILLRVDALSAAFLLVIFLVSGVGAVYGLGYWPGAERPGSAARVRAFYALMTVGLALVVTASHALLFLFAWELMAVSAFFLIATDDGEADVRRAAWVYFVATHAGTACLLAGFMVLRVSTGSFELRAMPAGPAASVVFVLAVFGFGSKAGIVPLHFWLPAAHANAPSHVSALLSAVMLKAGVYGILRVTGFVDRPPLGWGLLVAGLGALSAVCGIAMAAAQKDVKRALAYSSVENVGIIWLGIGLALAGRTLDQPLWTALGFCGALFHVFSHACFKSLLFLGSGGIVHAAGTRDMDRLGGLYRRMPVTGSLVVVGALAAAGLPLFNGFVGEWLIGLGLFETLRQGSASGWPLAFGVPALALAGALALASFVRIVGATFLGEPRSAGAAGAHEPPRLMTAPMALLAAACVGLGIWPAALLPVLVAAQAAWSGVPVAREVLAVHLSLPLPAFALLVLALLSVSAALRALLKPRETSRLESTWDCGYAAPTARMQYTATSSGASITSVLPPFLLPSAFGAPPAGIFPGPASFRTDAPDPFGAKLFEPFVAWWGRRFGRLRWLQRGQLSLYLVYVFLTTFLLLAWSVLRPGLR